MRWLRTAGVYAVVAAGSTIPRPASAQTEHAATLVAGADCDPYPVRIVTDDRGRAAIRGDSRRAGFDAAPGPSAFEAEREAMDREACIAILGDPGGCGSRATPAPGTFAGARVPAAFTSADPGSAGPDVGGAAVPAAPPAGAATAGGAAGDEGEASEGTVRPDLSWLEGLSLPDVPIRWDERLVWYLERYREDGRWRNTVIDWIRRSGEYADMVREVFRRHGLPEDLLWVAAIESGFSPSELSSAGAAGIWQFMPDGGRIFGLRQTRWVDERRNPERSTEAVALYLADLHARFGSWDMALAGFNMGYAGLERVVLKYGSNDYWTLARSEGALPYGTTFYVPKALAVAIVARNPELFGLGDLVVDPPRSYDTVEVRGVHRIAAMARAAGVPVDEFKTLNPEIRRDRTPPGEDTWLVRVPRGGEERFVRLLPGVEEADQVREYTVRFGESVDDVAYRFSTSGRRIRELNGLDREGRIRGGDVVEVPDVEPRDLPSPAERPVVVVPADTFVYPDRERLFYRAASGDTLDEIAAFFSVTPTDMTLWNEIDPETSLVPGMLLQVFAPAEFDPSTAVVTREGEVDMLTAGSPELYESIARREGRERTVYLVREGDTIEAIARRFGTTLTSLGRINGFGRRADLSPGDEIVIWASAGTAPVAPEEPLEPPSDDGTGLDAPGPPPGAP